MNADDVARSGIPAGVWEHWKGERYLVLGLARDATVEGRSDRLLVIYSRLYRRDGVPLNARPLDDFLREVPTSAGPVARFRYIGPGDDAASSTLDTQGP